MKRILIMDEKNYSLDLEEIYRVAVRGIIFIGGKLLMIEDDFGEVKLPGGGIESGEDDYKALVREVKEETGLDLIEITDVMNESFSAIGFSNEKNICVVGIAEGNFAPSTSTVEEIEAAWLTKEEVRERMKTEYFAARTQSYCYLWSKEK